MPAGIAVEANGKGEPLDLSCHPGAITAPMVGTAYLAPEPGAAPFVFLAVGSVPALLLLDGNARGAFSGPDLGFVALTAGFVLEEGFPRDELRALVASMAAAARAAGVAVAAGDTKVVERGAADGLYVTTAGVGLLDLRAVLGLDRVRAGDRLLVSGGIAEHGIALMLARGNLELELDVESDTAPLNGMVAALLAATPGVRALRDATRGGVATILNEIARAADVGVLVSEDAIPVRPEVRGAAELLGIDPMYVACEGRMVVVVDGDQADAALTALRAHPAGREAAVIGEVTAVPGGVVQLRTAFGGTRIVDLLVGDPLPRIC